MKHTLLKSILIGSSLAVISLSACALGKAQNFSDTYKTVGGQVLAFKSKSDNLKITKIDSNTIEVNEDNGSFSGGVFTVTAGTDSDHACQVTVRDVDFETPAKISQTCTEGYQVTGFTSDPNDPYHQVVITVAPSA